jgi:glycosyltransferase 2 family protein
MTLAVNLHKRKLLSSLIFLILGITLFWFVYRDFNFKELSKALKNLKFGWIIVSVGFGMLSHYIRALRWGMLINAMGQKPRNVNLFLSVIILYFTNLIIPRGGEVTRCAIVSKYEQVPFVKLVGTVFVERITDLFAFMLIFLIILLFQFRFFETVMNYPGFQLDFSSFHIKLMPVLLIASLITIMVLAMVKFRIFNKVYAKLKQLKGEFIEGISVIIHLKTKVKYIVYTFIIFLLWLLMLYVVFFAYTPTNKLSFIAAVLTYVFGTLAYLLPIQAGIGTWHFIVINCLFFYGIDKESGMIFALIAHTFTNLIFLILGPVAMAFLPIVNNKSPKAQKINSQIA